jgi:microcystin-dependent protein
MIATYAFDWAPRGWTLCNGQLLSIAQNQALFALLGTTYGGNGVTTFGLPDLRGRLATHVGQGPGLSNYALGQAGGEENHTLLASQMPQHTHLVSAVNTNASSRFPTGDLPGAVQGTATNIYSTGVPNTTMSPAVLPGVGGGSQPHTNMEPYLTVNFCLALQGIFPSRN